MSADALVITGPTATGKTVLAIEVAEELNGEIISMDSRQVYRGMDIGTAKPTPAQRARVPHHGLDLVGPDQRYSAGRFAADARRWIAAIRSRGRVPLLAGGTGFFLRALTHPLFAEPALPEPARTRLSHHLRSAAEAELRRWLECLDPHGAHTLERRGGRQRLERALEVALLTGRPLSWWHAHAAPSAPPLRPLIFVLHLPWPELRRRIDARVLAMVDAGLVEEVRGQLERGYHAEDPGMNATGYIELVPFIEGRCALADAIAAIQRATRRYARRQLTWLRHQLPPGAHWIDATRPGHELVRELTDTWKSDH